MAKRQLLKQRLVETLVEHLALGFELIGKFKPNRHMFDVDHFKRINDTYGHNVGDEVLKALANLVSTEVRVTDFFGRWGGEEFVLLLRDDDCEAAMAAAEKLRNLIASSDIPSVGKVTCSFGVAVA